MMELAQLKFQIQRGINVQQSQQRLMDVIREKQMTPFYLFLVKELKWHQDEVLVRELKAKNEAELATLTAKLEDAEKNFGETEVSDALQAIADFYIRIGDKDNSLKALSKSFDKAVGAGMKLDVVFAQIRIGMFFADFDLIQRNLDRAKVLVDEGGDWDRRNRLKVYQGIHLMSVRNFKDACPLLLDGLPTFMSTELMDYKDFVKYTVLASILSVERKEMKTKVLESPEILEVLHEIPHLTDYVQSLYFCKYGQFFRSLAAIEDYLKNDRYLHPHYNWYTREMRILAYKQILESYRSLSLDSMAKHFGVTVEFIDRDLSRFISAGRLHCVIDKVDGIVQTKRPDTKNAQYQLCIKEGDILLNRIQKLGRVINV